METWEVLERAADEMERRGKAVGELIGADGSVCAIQAVHIASGTPRALDENYDVERLDVVSALVSGAALGTNERTDEIDAVYEWSDTTDIGTVTSTMRAVAATLRAQSPAKPVPILTYAGER